MTYHFNSRGFDVAPLAPRHSRAAWWVLVAGVLFALGCIWPLSLSWQSLHLAQVEQAQADASVRQQNESRRGALSQQNEPAVRERAKAQLQLERTMRMSWAGLFEALELAALKARGGVSVLSLVPTKTQDAAAWVKLVGVAASTPSMLAYLDALNTSPSVEQVELTSQQPEDKEGAEAIRFQLSILWNPSVPVLITSGDNTIATGVASGSGKPTGRPAGVSRQVKKSSNEAARPPIGLDPSNKPP